MPFTGRGWFKRKKRLPQHYGDWREYRQRRIERERQRILGTYGETALVVLDIFARHDPLMIVCDANPGEYEPVVRTIVPRLQSAQCAEDVEHIAYEEVVHWNGGAKAGISSTYCDLGQEIWEAIMGAASRLP